MAKTLGIRHRLITLVLLGTVTSALSLVALVRILSLTTAQRMERARDAAREEAEQLGSTPSRHTVEAPPAMARIGLVGGYLLPGAALPAEWKQPLESALREAAQGHASALAEHARGEDTQVVCVRPIAQGGHAWAGFLVQPPTYLRTWQIIVVLLSIATALLVASSLYTVFTLKRSTVELSASLVESREAQGRLAQELTKQERLAALGRVAAGVAHEVRNPLASIKLQLDLTAAGEKLPDKAALAIQSASQEISRLDRLVSDLLVVAGRQMGPLRSVSLGPLVQSRVAALEPWSAARGVSIHAEGDATGALDAESIARALDNVLRNAVEASAQGGSVEVRVAVREQAIQVLVEDRGQGVNPERAAELFEPFFTTKPEGTGLGLAISRAIARAHGGDLTYTRSGSTTRFELSLGRGEARG